MFSHDNSMRVFTISNLLTASRLVVTPFVVAALLKHLWGVALILLILAGVSDLLDGFIARLLNEPTWLGSILDPIADKCLVGSSLVAFFISSSQVLLPAWFVLLIVARECFLLVGGGILFFIRPSFYVQPNILGKAATFLMLALMIMTLSGAVTGFNFELLRACLLYSTFMCATVSFFQYFYRGLKALFYV